MQVVKPPTGKYQLILFNRVEVWVIDIFLLEVSPLAFGFHSPIVIDAVINRAKFLKVIQISQLNITQTNYSFFLSHRLWVPRTANLFRVSFKLYLSE